MIKKKLLAPAVALVLLAAPPAGGAAEAKEIVCAVLHVVACDGLEACEEGSPRSFDVPPIIHIDLANGEIWGTRVDGTDRRSAIAQQSESDGVLFLQGMENGMGWNLTLAFESREMTLTASAPEEAFAVFGSCETLEDQ